MKVLLERDRREGTYQIPELNDGFLPAYWCKNSNLTIIGMDQHGSFAETEKGWEVPLTLVYPVQKEGNYQVTVKIYASQDVKEAKLFLGRRRLAWFRDMKAGEVFTGSFVTNLCPIIPRGYTEEMEDLTIDITVIGVGVHLMVESIAPFKGKTLYIAGDSTVTDQSADYPYLPERSYCGWGQMLSAYLKKQMAVSNHAHSGLTTESFRREGSYDILYRRIKPGDLCLFQFGHNDQKLMELKAKEGYRDRLLTYIREVREKGGVPVLVTPLARNSWKGIDGSYNDLLDDYARVCIKIGEEEQVPVIDLHQKSMDLITRLGRDQAKAYFFPSDYTHSNDYGAYLFAGFVYEEMVRLKLAAFEAYLPLLPPAEMRQIEIPEEYAKVENPNVEKLFVHLEREEEPLTRAEAFEMAIQTMHFFPTNVYNDMFADVIGHETYAGSVECAWQNGMIPESMIQTELSAEIVRRIEPEKNITGEEFLLVLQNAYHSRKPEKLDLESILPEGFEPEKEIMRKTAAQICRQIHI